MPGTISAEHLNRFERAYSSWHQQRIEIVSASAVLWDVSQSMVQLQDELGPRFDALHRTHRLPPPELLEGWADGMTWLMVRHVRTLRSVVKRGHHQVATRSTLAAMLIFKAVWDSYRAATNN